ncbi:MAG: penicillin acylase family protein [Gemmatimonadota bacterium]|nr:MAG: penicillin acylase family protein [Gemmatimonadota bacterium]
MTRVRTIAAAVVLAALLFVGFRPVGSLPAVGRLLDPWSGVWSVATTAHLPEHAVGGIPGLRDSVLVLYDDRAVPHVFAASPEDAARAMGYVVARDRLFQLDLQARAPAGKLTELLGARALPLDREMRRLGLPQSADRAFAALDSTSEMYRTMGAYAAGVNAWIDGLGRRDLPFEYHLLGARPARWEPVNTLYLLRRMGHMLAYSADELRRERVAALVGEAAADALFPVESPIQEPVQPGAGEHPRVDSTPLPPPGEPAAPPSLVVRGPDERGRVQASNNWAVAPAKSATGYALLEGDPHLLLTLPSIWYEAHLVVPEVLDVYGVTLTGSPSIIIGFNRDVAWSFTTNTADVLDYYVEELDDSERPARYRLDGEWRPLAARVEEYLGARGEVLAADTVYSTHRGPIVWRNGRALSLRWTVLEDQGTSEALYRATTARSVDEWLRTMEAYEAPSQTAVVADRAGNIAVRALGRVPLRPGDGRGDRLFDGTTSASDWVGWWPLERQPFALNPQQGYVASANQQPIDPEDDDTYLGVNWFPPWRAMRINRLLREHDAVTPDDLRRFQTDPGSARADRFVPWFLAASRRLTQAGRDPAGLVAAAALLAEWDRRYTRENARAVLFELAIEELEDRTWDELVPPGEGDASPDARVATPMESVLYRLLYDERSAWWDVRATADVVEDRDLILGQSLAAALERATERYGDPADGGWRWERIRHANIYHLLYVRSLSALGLPVQGGPSTLSPSSGSGVWGASWRQVVELGPEVTARVIYPGGQSGNPVSPRYDDRIAKWQVGELDSALMPELPSQLPADRVLATLVLRPER